MKRKTHAVERFFVGQPISIELKIADVGGQKVFPVPVRSREVLVFIEFNGYRKCVGFPAKPAVSSGEKKK